MLRYRLWDLDRLVSRTVTYAAITVMLVVPYLVILPVAVRHELAAQREQWQRRRDQQRERDAADRRKRHEVREQDRRDAAQKRQHEQILADQGVARAKAQTADVRAAVAALEAVLTHRSRNLGSHRATLVAAVDHGDVTEVGDIVQAVLASSSYPDGVSVQCRTYTSRTYTSQRQASC